MTCTLIRFLPAWAAAFVVLGGLAAAVPDRAEAASSAIVIMYHRFGETGFPSTNTTVEQLEAHIEELTTGGYSVLALDEIVAKLRGGEELPDRTVGLSIDDAYRSIYEVAWPRFKAAGLPFTIFVSTGHVDQGSPRHLTWDQIREMHADGVGIGHHTVLHLHMAAADRARNESEIADAFRRFEKEMGHRPPLFAYPYGEASLEAVSVAREAGFAAAFGQHSGAIHRSGDFFYLPRFSMNERYGDLARFRMAASAQAIPVSDVTPADHLVGAKNPPAVGFTVASEVSGLDRLACFSSHEGRVQLERLGAQRVEVRFTKALPKGRTRLNCTLPTRSGRWRWLGRQFINH